MGACIGKKSSKHQKRTSHPVIRIEPPPPPQPQTQDDVSENKSSPSPSKKLSVTDGLTVNNDDEWRISQLSGNSVDSEIRIIIEEQKLINEAFGQPFGGQFTSITDTELEFELANLMFEPTEDKNNNVENSSTLPTDKDKDKNVS